MPSDTPVHATPPRDGRFPLKVALAYALVTAACALFSDRLFATFVTAPQDLAAWSQAKRLIFIAISTPLLYWLLAQREKRIAHAEAALRASEDRLTRMAALSSDWYWETDENFRISLVSGTSPVGESVPTRAVLGKRVIDFREMRIDSMTADEFETLRRAHKPYRDVRFCAKGPDDRDLWFTISGEPRFDPHGNFAGYRGMCRDITTEMETLERLRLSEANFRAIAEHPTIAKSLFLPGRRAIFVNQAYCRLFGYTQEEFLSGTIRRFSHPDDEPETLRLLDEIAQGKRDNYRQKKRFFRKDGSLIWAEVDVTAVRDEAGRLKHMVSQVQDLSALQDAEAAARDARDRLRGMFELAAMGITEVALDGRFLRVNPAFCRITGYEEAELLALAGTDITPEEDRHLSRDLMAEAVAGARDRFVVEKRYRRKDGGLVWVELTSALARDAEGRPAYFVSVTQDISARRAAQEELRASEARYRTVVDALSESIMVVGPDGSLETVNPATRGIFGVDYDAMVAGERPRVVMRLFDESGAEVPVQERPALVARHRGETVHGRKLRAVRSDGSEIWIRATAIPLVMAGWNDPGVLVLTADISAEHVAETALRLSEQRYRSVVEALAEAVLVLDPDGKPLAVNQATRTVFGADFQELLDNGPRSSGLRLFDATGRPIPPGQRPSERALREGLSSHRVIAHAVRSDGSAIWLRISARPIALQDHEQRGCLLVLADINAERLAEIALRASEHRYRTVIETMAEGVLLFDVDDRVVGANAAALRMLGAEGASHAEIDDQLGRLRVYEIDGRQLGSDERLTRRVLTTGEPIVATTFRVERPDGVRAWHEISARQIRLAEDDTPGVLFTMSDVTTRVEAEQALKGLTDHLERRVMERTAELSQVNRELESFAYSVSHDLRAPLRAITGFATLLRSEERERLSPDGQELLERVAANAERMGELIDDVLEYSRITRIDQKRETVDVDAIVAEVLAPLAAAHPAVRVHVASPLGRADADPAMLRQIFENLLGNAFKYTAKVASPEVAVEAGVEDGLTWYIVRDNGAGFDMRYADRLFGMFQRMHAPSEFPGTGVGLAIVKRLVERHGGQVQAKAEIGRGAMFRFTLGEHAAQPAAAP